MRRRSLNPFPTIRSEGGLLPPDLLVRLIEGDASLGGLDPTSFHLEDTDRLNEAASRAWTVARRAWDDFQAVRSALPGGDSGTTPTRERWLLRLFSELGYGRLQTSRLGDRDERAKGLSHCWQQTPIHLVGCGVDLDKRTPGTAGAARTSPHGLVQQALNGSDDLLWGFVSNGVRLRVLRDSARITRLAYVEFDLELMMTGEVFSDFFVLWLICHQSRVEPQEPSKPETCWLEQWVRAAEKQGSRALEDLRQGVTDAIELLGRGFLSHPESSAMRNSLRSGALDSQDYYRQLLRLVYRLIFLLVAEDRDLLLVAPAEAPERRRYKEFYSAERLRRLAERRRGGRHSDLWQAIRLVMVSLGSDKGCPDLGLPALGSFLWSSEAMSAVEGAAIANADLLEAVRALAFDRRSDTFRPLDFKNLGSEELGSVYESLLELRPKIDVISGRFDLETLAGHERKTTGSYYTPSSLIQCLLDSALDPVLEEAARKRSAEKAILALRVCDPACGSGHFLVAAAHRIARRLASVRTGGGEPSPEAARNALRDVIMHCIYGVDINPMAVELCKVSLWMEAMQPGKPLAFVDHRILCGDSLLGMTPKLLEGGIPSNAFNPIEGDEKEFAASLRQRNRREREGQMALPFVAEATAAYGGFSAAIAALDRIDADSIASLHEKEAKWRSMTESEEYGRARLSADAWCAAFVWEKTKDAPPPMTHDSFMRLAHDPLRVPPAVYDEVVRLYEQYHFFHWHLAFPDVFQVPDAGEQPENAAAGWSGGFNVVVGNPPWERVKLQEAEWFAPRRPDISMAPNAAARKALIARLATEDPPLHAAFREAIRCAEAESMFLRGAGRYPLCGRGDINSYAVFAETFYTVAGPNSACGLIVPSGILADDTTKLFFKELQNNRALAQAIDFENNETLFPGVGHGRMPFCLLTMRKGVQTHAARLFFLARDVSDLADDQRWFELGPGDAAAINPNSETCPVFLSRRDAEITKTVYRRFPVLRRESPQESAWGARLHTVFHMTTDSPLLRTAEALGTEGWSRDGRVFRRGSETMLPIIEGKMVTFYDHRAAHIRLNPSAPTRQQQTEDTSQHEKQSAAFFPDAYLWAPQEVAHQRFHEDVHRDWAIALKRVTSATNWRTMVACVVPDTLAISYTLYLLELSGPGESRQHCLLAMLNSFAYDYFVRQKTMQPSLPIGPVYETVMPPPRSFDDPAPWTGGVPLNEWIAPRVAELICVSDDLVKFGVATLERAATFRWMPERRELLRAELDAMAFHVFGLSRAEVEHVLSTFPKVREYDIREHGGYRSMHLILGVYDEMEAATRCGGQYETPLQPKPADREIEHTAVLKNCSTA